MFDDFSYSAYGKLLDLAGHDGRVNLCFSDFPMAKEPDRYFILRHDVDLCPAAALRMAEFEADHGARATYFLLLSTPFYNLLSEEFAAVPRQLVEMGHDVGLHYDLMAYRARGTDPRGILDSEARLLGELCGRPVRSISMHKPSVHGPNLFLGQRGYINAYDPQFASQIGYVSDSAGAWRDETVRILAQNLLPPRLQLLVHPIFWDHGPADRWARLESFWRRRSGQIERAAHAEGANWRDHEGVKQHDRRVGASAAAGINRLQPSSA